MRTLPKVMAVDNERDVLETIAFTLDGHYEIVGFTNGAQAITEAEHEIFPCAIVDLQMEPMSGMEVMRQLKKANPCMQVIILTGHACMETAIEAVNSDVYQYIQKPFRREPFLQVISGAFKRYETALLAIERLPITHDQLRAMGLTPRIADVALGILAHKTNDEIATDLRISCRTVEKHVEHLLGHFNSPNRFLLESKVQTQLRQQAPGT